MATHPKKSKRALLEESGAGPAVPSPLPERREVAEEMRVKDPGVRGKAGRPEATETQAPTPRRGRPPKKERPELPDSVEELNRVTGGLRPFARPVVRAYSDLMEFVSDEALDDDEKQMGTETVAALMWYYGLTHPAVLGLLFVGGTLGRRAPKIARKLQAKKANRLGGTVALRTVHPSEVVKPVAAPAPVS